MSNNELLDDMLKSIEAWTHQINFIYSQGGTWNYGIYFIWSYVELDGIARFQPCRGSTKDRDTDHVCLSPYITSLDEAKAICGSDLKTATADVLAKHYELVVKLIPSIQSGEITKHGEWEYAISKKHSKELTAADPVRLLREATI